MPEDLEDLLLLLEQLQLPDVHRVQRGEGLVICLGPRVLAG
jgi:hypothetical protein